MMMMMTHGADVSIIVGNDTWGRCRYWSQWCQCPVHAVLMYMLLRSGLTDDSCVFVFQWLRVFNILSSVHCECQWGWATAAVIVSRHYVTSSHWHFWL